MAESTEGLNLSAQFFAESLTTRFPSPARGAAVERRSGSDGLIGWGNSQVP